MGDFETAFPEKNDRTSLYEVGSYIHAIVVYTAVSHYRHPSSNLHHPIPSLLHIRTFSPRGFDTGSINEDNK